MIDLFFIGRSFLLNLLSKIYKSVMDCYNHKCTCMYIDVCLAINIILCVLKLNKLFVFGCVHVGL